MPLGSPPDGGPLIGRALDRLTNREITRLAGQWVALEIYTPATLPLRRIEALGPSSEDCISQLAARALDPRRFEFVLLNPLP
jgi:hypothetical protein